MGIQPKQVLVGLTRLNWTTFGTNGWLIGRFPWPISYVTQFLVTLMDINWILKIIAFGLVLLTNDIVNLKH